MSSQQTEALVIRRQDFGESDIILTVFTPGFGKLRVLIKSGRKSTSKLAGPCQFLNQINITVYLKLHKDIHKLIQVELIQSRENIRSDLDKLSWASVAMEFLQRTTAEHQADKEIYQLTSQYLDRMTGANDSLQLTLIYLIQLLQLSGFGPLLSQCIACRKIRPLIDQLDKPVYYFDSQKGGLLCTLCSDKKRDKSELYPLAREQIRFLELSQQIKTNQWTTIRLTPTRAKELLEFLLAHARYQLEGEFKSVRFLQFLNSDPTH